VPKPVVAIVLKMLLLRNVRIDCMENDNIMRDKEKNQMKRSDYLFTMYYTH
jgi:hypothetical protein